MTDDMNIYTEERPSGVLIIHIEGDLDSMGTRSVEAQFTNAIPDRNATILINLSDVGFISSAGMAMLLVKGKALRQGGGSMNLAAPSQRVYEVLSLAGFHELFNVYGSVDEALDYLEG